METDSLLRLQLPPPPGWARNAVRTDRFPSSILALSYSIPAKTRKCLKKKKIYRKWEERRALDIFKTQILSEFWEENFGSVTLSDWFAYPSPNPCVYCRALWFPSSGPLGYLGWQGAWVLLPFSLMHLCVPSHWILQRQVLNLHILFFCD